MNLKWLKDMSHDINIRHDTIKLLEENTDNVFLAQSPKAIEIKAKINKWKVIKFTGFYTAKEIIN